MFVCSQSEVQLKGEVAVRNQLLHAMAEQQNLMDALTAVSVLFTLYIHVHVHVFVECVHTCTCTCTCIRCFPKDVVKLQEENSSLKSGFQQLEQHTTQQTKSLEVLWFHTECFGRSIIMCNPCPRGIPRFSCVIPTNWDGW